MFATEVTPFLFSQLAPAEREWLEKSVSPIGFILAARRIRRVPVICQEPTEWAIQANRQGWTLDHWVRVWILTQLPPADIQRLFDTAEMRELVALVTALPWLPDPASWMLRATDAVRSNVGDVLEAIAYANPYPARYFSEAAWNQLVLKVLFNEKSLGRMEGLAARQNQALAEDILFLAKERWSAGRSLSPVAWQLVAPFPSPAARALVTQLAKRPSLGDQQAAQLLFSAWEASVPTPAFTWQDII